MSGHGAAIEATRALLSSMAPDDLAAYAAVLSIRPGADGPVEALLARVADPAWVMEQATALSWLARCALIAAAWAGQDPVGIFEPGGVVDEDDPRELVLAAAEEVDVSGLWLAEESPTLLDVGRRLVLPATARVLRMQGHELFGASARSEASHPSLGPLARSVKVLAALANEAPRVRKDGSVGRRVAARVAALLGVDPDGLDGPLGLLARAATRVGWLGPTDADGSLGLLAAALVEDAPSRRDVLAAMVAGAVSVAPSVGVALAALTAAPAMAAMPVRVFHGILAHGRDPRIPGSLDLELHDLERQTAAAPALLALCNVIVFAARDREIFVVLHPAARAALRSEPALEEVAAPIVQSSLEVLLPPECPAEPYLRMASLASFESADVVDRLRLLPERLQAALDLGLSKEAAHAWLLAACPDAALPQGVVHMLDSAVERDVRCEVVAGVPLRLGPAARAALLRDPHLSAAVLDGDPSGLVVLRPEALRLLPGWARREHIALHGLSWWSERVHGAGHHEEPTDWRSLAPRLSALLAELKEPVTEVQLLPATSQLVYPPLLLLDDAIDRRTPNGASRAIAALLATLGGLDERPEPEPVSPEERAEAYAALPEAYRHLRHAFSTDIAAVLASAQRSGLAVEAHLAVRRGRHTVRRVFVPLALVPDEGAPRAVTVEGDEVVAMHDIRALRVLDPREERPEDPRP